MNKGEEFTKQWGKLRKEKLNYFHSLSNTATLIKKWDFHEKENVEAVCEYSSPRCHILLVYVLTFLFIYY